MQAPAQWARLQNDPALMRTAVEEIVRWTTPSCYKRRTATRDLSFAGKRIREGDKVTFWEMSANRDEHMFERPFEFDIARNPNKHLGFGAGVHRCLGSNLARLEFQVALEQVLARMPDHTLAPGAEAVFHGNSVTRGFRCIPVAFTPGTRVS